ncbi:hypothetical protein NQZ68_030708 [Dissostichus eleginoides]|nr:hypothetical protein NQZ68_030708 [Dissostichus eleginoides]
MERKSMEERYLRSSTTADSIIQSQVPLYWLHGAGDIIITPPLLFPCCDSNGGPELVEGLVNNLGALVHFNNLACKASRDIHKCISIIVEEEETSPY